MITLRLVNISGKISQKTIDHGMLHSMETPVVTGFTHLPIAIFKSTLLILGIALLLIMDPRSANGTTVTFWQHLQLLLIGQWLPSFTVIQTWAGNGGTILGLVSVIGFTSGAGTKLWPFLLHFVTDSSDMICLVHCGTGTWLVVLLTGGTKSPVTTSFLVFMLVMDIISYGSGQPRRVEL